jgi:PqqD family protein of HPr-rel-A system
LSDTPTFDRRTIKTPTRACFLFQHWDGESVVYNNMSGETHLLEQNSAELLSSIQEQPLSYQSLFNMLITTSSERSHEEIENYLNNVLIHFQELNLIDVEAEKESPN